MSFRLAILGRPNVGKSTLFNRLAGKKLAIVDDYAGVTRDWRVHPGKLGDLKFEVIDTAGLSGFESEDLKTQIQDQTQRVLSTAQIILFMTDGRDGLLPDDQMLIRSLQKSQHDKIILLVVNKCENSKTAQSTVEFYQLGLGDPIPISAEHGLGLQDLHDVLLKIAQERGWDHKTHEDLDTDIDYDAQSRDGESFAELDTVEHSNKPLKLAVVGRPNAGKSTLINALLQEERLLTGAEAGITRDSIGVDWQFEGREIKLFDTAGMRRKSRVEAGLERLSVSDTLKAIQFSEVTVLVLDAQSPLDKQDLLIAEHVIKEGRNLVIALNKTDLPGTPAINDLKGLLYDVLSQVKGVPIVGVSAKNGKNLSKLMQAVLKQDLLWNTRISTAVLNDWLRDVTAKHPPPIVGNRRLKLKYMTQIKTRPPTFVLFASKPVDLPDSYRRYLLNELRSEFELPGVTIRLGLRKGANPYENSKK